MRRSLADAHVAFIAANTRQLRIRRGLTQHELSEEAGKERAVACWERGYLADLIRQSGGNLSKAARAARMDRSHLRELLRRHNVPAREG